MSHFQERTEKDCLNCGTQVLGRYCQVCGQENREPKETFWYLITHFFNDITHFDGKFFNTLRYLIFRPGLLSREYVRGRRQSYLHPVRMYVFTSAFFFLIFFSLSVGNVPVIVSPDVSLTDLRSNRDLLEKLLGTTNDPVLRATLRQKIADTDSSIADVQNTMQAMKDLDSPEAKKELRASIRPGWDYDNLPPSVARYDSIVAATPPAKRQGWLKRKVNRKITQIDEDFNADPKKFIQESKDAVIHTFPKILFVSLPLFALLLRLLYIHRRKDFLYVDHGIFTIHLYCAAFIFMFLTILLQRLHWELLDWIKGVLTLGIFVYEYMAMKHFYRQGWGKTFLKFVILDIAAVFLLGIITAFFSIWAVIEL